MAQYTVYINDEELHEDDVLDIKKSAYDLNFAGDKLISNKTEITLSNFHYKFDTRRGTDGYFETIEWFNNPVRIIDNRDGTTFFEGRLKNLKLNDNKMTLTLEVSDYLQDMTDTICVISELDTTPAEAIYSILTNPSYLNIPEDKIIKGAFDYAAILQDERRVKISFTLEDNVNCIDVIEELCKISCYSKVFLVDNKISYWVWTPYYGAQGFPIDEISPGSYSEEIKFDIINECSIAYESGSNIARVTNSSEASQTKYGAGKAFLMPDKNVESNLSADYKILYKTEAGASAVANEILNRMKDVKKVCKFTISDELSFLQLGNDVELKFKPFVREPVRIIGIQPDTKKNLLNITAEFLNYPELFPIDISKPDAPELFSVQSINDGKIIIKWIPYNTEITNYTLYFSKTGSNWEDLLINNARSPIILTPDGIDNGLFYKVLEGFSPGETYYFRMKVIGTNFLLSDFSNTLTLKHRLYEDNFDLYGNAYRTDGDIFDGIYITPDNPLSGTAPDFLKYDVVNYDEDFHAPVYGEYISQVFMSETGFKNFTFFTKYLSRNDSIKIFKRTQNSDNSFNEWEGYYLINGEEVLDTEGAKRIQFRFWFNVPLLSSNDLIYITNYEEI